MRVAIFRLGAMGSRMAAALLAAGHSVVVWNRTPDRAQALVERGARLARTPREAVEDVEIAVATVRDDEASRRVWLSREYRALAGMPASAVGIESSTLSVAWVRELLAAKESFADRGRYLNFPGFHEEGEATMRATFGAKYDRLTALKNTYDPSNLFRLNANVTPTV